MIFKLDSFYDGPTCIIRVRGEVDINTTGLLIDLAETILVRPGQRLTIDLASTTFFGAAGIRALLAIEHAADAGHVTFRPA